jgi:hypothetical protein
MAELSFPCHFKIVTAATPTQSDSTITCDNISMKDAAKVWIVAQLQNASGHAVVFNPLLGTAVATCATAITFAAPYWYNYDTSTSDTLVAGTAATTVTASAAATPALYVIEIDPQQAVAQGATLDCLGCTITGGAHAGDFDAVLYIIEPRYKSATPPTAITD